jgi:hypothetical protein
MFIMERYEREKKNAPIRKWVYEFRKEHDRTPSYEEMIAIFPDLNRYSYSGFVNSRGRDEHLCVKIIKASDKYFAENNQRPTVRTLSEILDKGQKALSKYFDAHPELEMYRVSSPQGAKGKVDLVINRHTGAAWAAEFHNAYVDVWQVSIHGEGQICSRQSYKDFQTNYMGLEEAGIRA